MQPSAGKLMLAIFWDSQWPILETCLECGTTVTSATYCNMLQGGLRPAICSKRSGRLSEGILLLHDNACPHTTTCTLVTLRKLKWEVVNVQLIVQIWRQQIVTFLDCLKELKLALTVRRQAAVTQSVSIVCLQTQAMEFS
jgi:hypothetical protein